MLKLKDVLAGLRLQQKTLAKALDLSTASVAQLVNHNQWPKSLSADSIKEKVQGFLREHGASQQAIDTAFEIAEPARCTASAPLGDFQSMEEAM